MYTLPSIIFKYNNMYTNYRNTRLSVKTFLSKMKEQIDQILDFARFAITDSIHLRFDIHSKNGMLNTRYELKSCKCFF